VSSLLKLWWAHPWILLLRALRRKLLRLLLILERLVDILALGLCWRSLGVLLLLLKMLLSRRFPNRSTGQLSVKIIGGHGLGDAVVVIVEYW
jgi:hypothetical protein